MWRGYIFSENSRENKLTPWSNDPVIDPIYETIFIRDDETGDIFTVTPKPIRHQSEYVITYGTGYVRYKHQHNGLIGELNCFVPKDDMLKISLLNLKNTSNTRRKLSIFYYIKPVMGVTNFLTNQFIVSQFDSKLNSFIFKNSYNTDFPNRLMFITSSEKIVSYTGNLNEFLQDENRLDTPEGLNYETLSNTVGAGFNPCSIVQIKLTIEENQEKEISLLLGSCLNYEDLNNIIENYKDVGNCRKNLMKLYLCGIN
ncbi:hypothetical protein PL321_14200 [Caloramator sp. mosi_1]|uniref:hypothetical protein n=1 Tax=Caloramator sp. mosi_1 TaxID=3023090 RepID=UPI00235EFFCB|nr:hypothetical protein [Caloramator sp. mosi_1]WDC83709.1 hypothetical protein PL321_14200 [Caloramator sp. mosi_1]